MENFQCDLKSPVKTIDMMELALGCMGDWCVNVDMKKFHLWEKDRLGRGYLHRIIS